MATQLNKMYKMQQDLKSNERVTYINDVLGTEHFSGTDPRRRRELHDFNIINEDHNAIANLPTNFMHKTFDREPGYKGLRTSDTDSSF